jgi:purine-binding chemotaxis protein CheW
MTPADRAPAAEERPHKEANILKTRAKELAEEHDDETAVEASIEVLEFILANERYAIETSFIREVYPMKEYTSIPGTPPFVLGLINIRGQVLSVIDIRRFFDLSIKGLSDLNRVMVIQTPRLEIGVLADRIVGVRHVLQSELQPALPTMSGIRSDYLRGITQEGLAVLDIQKMTADPKLMVNEEVE